MGKQDSALHGRRRARRRSVRQHWGAIVSSSCASDPSITSRAAGEQADVACAAAGAFANASCSLRFSLSAWLAVPVPDVGNRLALCEPTTRRGPAIESTVAAPSTTRIKYHAGIKLPPTTASVLDFERHDKLRNSSLYSDRHCGSIDKSPPVEDLKDCGGFFVSECLLPHVEFDYSPLGMNENQALEGLVFFARIASARRPMNGHGHPSRSILLVLAPGAAHGSGRAYALMGASCVAFSSR